MRAFHSGHILNILTIKPSPKGVTSDDESALKRRGSTRRKQTPPPLIGADSEAAVATLTAPPSPVRALIANVDAAISNALPDTQALVQAAERTGTGLRTQAKVLYGKSRKVCLSCRPFLELTNNLLVHVQFHEYC